MSFISTVLSDLKLALAHPATVRKELVATATVVAAELTTFNSLIHLPPSVQAVLTGITSVATFIVTFLSPDSQSKASARASVK